jgi:wobble nucleotide-excising tRNase
MIESMTLRDEASFDADGQTLDGLKAINFIYGTNGSGKTTVSRIIANEQRFSSCQLRWRDGRKLEALVYNRDFVEQNFHPDREVKGIFTLGEDNEAATRAIADLNVEIAQIDADVRALTRTLDGDGANRGKRQELEDLSSEFDEFAWSIKSRYDSSFMQAFAGVRDKKSKFRVRLEQAAASSIADLPDLEDLQKRASTVFAVNLEKDAAIREPRHQPLTALEDAAILAKRVVGSSDAEIAGLIDSLSNSDWVKEGLRFLEKSNPVCPFCQQHIDEALAQHLRDYFDESYMKDVASLDQLIIKYREASHAVVTQIVEIVDARPKHLNIEAIERDLRTLEAKIRTNIGRLEQKKKEPSRGIELDSVVEALESITGLIRAANRQIADHNATLDNLSEERANLTSQIWQFIFNKAKPYYDKFRRKSQGLAAAVGSLEQQIRDKNSERLKKQRRIGDLEQKITSVQPTVSAINRILGSFGFSGFRLAESEKKGSYRIIRDDGSDAQKTLSEGERTFLTFLYFYHLLRGSFSASDTTARRVVVFDDPISSLDSDALFLVSTLVKNIIDEIRTENSQFEQVFVLTHNIYFHREVTFSKRRSQGRAMRDETFWVLRKLNGHSVAQIYDVNPVRTSYELLWSDVRDPHRSPATIQNTLRRILENYFKILGNVDPDQIVDGFEGEEKLVCASLFSWLHAGSHYTDEDLHVAGSPETVERYLKVFRRIFEQTNHLAHYEMMMGNQTV